MLRVPPSRHTVGGQLALLVLVIICWGMVGRDPLPVTTLGPPQEVYTSYPSLGVHTRLTDEVEPRKIKRTLQMVRELGASWVVEYFPWAYAEPEAGRYDFTHADLLVNHALQQGLKVIARIDYVPAWARPADSTVRLLPEEAYQRYAAFVAVFAHHFRGRVNYIVVWNEPNLVFEWGMRPADPEAYTRLLAQSYKAIKAVAPETQVLAAGLAPTEGDGANMSDLEFLKRMIMAGGGQWMDGLAAHAYGRTVPATEPPDAGRINFRRVELYHDMLVRAGYEGLPLYITESGWNDNQHWVWAVSPAQRIQYTLSALQVARDWPWCRVLAVWVLRLPWRTYTFQDNFTMVDTDFEPLPLYLEVQKWVGEK
ncbi:MAG: hypothetical protein EXR62_05805 [Chloroflexi bacterium]|nr:hypothetical protein [Chloroflexota bacterium]